MMNEDIRKPCACNKQIVWFVTGDGLGTVFVCKNCELTFHYSQEKCPYCKSELTEFREVEE